MKKILSNLKKWTKQILFDALVFMILTVCLYFIFSGENRNVVVGQIVFENVAVHSFIITWWLNAALLGFVYIIWGPKIYSDSFKLRVRANSHELTFKRRMSFMFAYSNNLAYTYVFSHLNQFCFSVGIGTLGVLLGLTLSILIDGEFSTALKGFGAAILMIFYLQVTLFLRDSVRFISEYFNEKENQVEIPLSRIFIFFAVIVLAVGGVASTKKTIQDIKKKIKDSECVTTLNDNQPSELTNLY